MDYIALNHDHDRVQGVIYNSRKPIGGVHYYDDKDRPVKVEQDPTTGRKQAFVEIEKKFKEKEKEFIQRNKAEIKKIGEKYEEKYSDDFDKKEKILAEKIGDLEAEKIRFERRIERQKARAYNRVQRKIKREQEELEEERLEIAKKQERSRYRGDGYVVSIQGKDIDFGKEGIKKAKLTSADKEWLKKAQNYFIMAKEKGRRIGSAEEYTSMEALEALWSTAEHVGIDPKRFLVQIYNETRFNPSARGRAGERGIGQFKKATAQAYGYEWSKMTAGIKTYAYQAKAAAEFVKTVGEVAYNGKGARARRYRDKISVRMNNIVRYSPACVLKNPDLCISKT